MKLAFRAYMNAISCIFLLVITALFFVGCNVRENKGAASVWMKDNGKLKVLCTTAMCSEIVSEIAKDFADCHTLIRGESDPHSYQLVKGDDEKFARADIIFSSGLGLEHGPSLRALLEKNPKAYSLGNFLAVNYPKKIIFVDRTPDPHVWMDVSLWSATIPYVAEILVEHYPEHEPQIRARSESLRSKLQEVDAQIRQDFMNIVDSKKYLITTHSSCNYFTRAYLSTTEEQEDGSWRKRCQSPEGLSPESQLSTADIQQLIAYVEEHSVEVAFIESNVNYDSLKKVREIMKKKGKPFRVCTEPLYTDAMGSKDSRADTYSTMMLHDASVISRNLASVGN